ncbi:NAD-dependent epimerase/dehydratase family protein [Variovorax sp. PCZ-1]|uniref:NAD-dependent epimerase/dehydratase family protein n=1 Tax=Variovorax sp. PCZ-1 TaxID=2835533 RepID=UPI001BCDE2A2|nr:NAD-dependent epimerase/dehydratase family protein [Variovorax sp. PCZ-1]MBS7808569.1 NAD-dependent epimerase/dehydratase family protein [Variovorax sp. PCZ-1]
MVSKQIALLGANSHIGKGLISEFIRHRPDEFATTVLYARDPCALSAWIKAEFQIEKLAHHPKVFGQKQFDIVINAIGVSDMVRIAEIGSQVFDINRHYDERVMSYLDSFPATKYIYLSSGAVYGGAFEEPTTSDTCAHVNLNMPSQLDWYGLAKLSSEIRHRSKSDLAIVDVRIFGYVSSWLPTDRPFFLVDVVKALMDRTPLSTDRKDFWRDYIGPTELAQVVYSIIDSPASNTSIDVYSAAPILKTYLLEVLIRDFSLRVDYKEDDQFESNAAYKFNYFSTDRRAKSFGYIPKRTSEQVVVQELSRFLHMSSSAPSNSK